MWDLIHFVLLDWLARGDQIDWSRAVVDSCFIRAAVRRGPDRAESYRSGQAREQAPSDLRWAGRAARGASDRREPERLVRSPGVGGCDSSAARRTRSTEAAAGLCARGSRLRCGHDPTRSPGASDRALAGRPPHQARERTGPISLGCRAHVCLAESVSPPAGPVRQVGRHSRGVPVARVRADLLAIAAQDMENRLRPMPSFPGVHRPGRCISTEIASCGYLGAQGGGAGHQ